MRTRIYKVLHEDKTHLVEARSATDAIWFLTCGLYLASVAKPKEIAELMGRGMKVQIATGRSDPLP